eukprot:2290340-Pleurochrysis_carterae.AAC.1
MVANGVPENGESVPPVLRNVLIPERDVAQRRAAAADRPAERCRRRRLFPGLGVEADLRDARGACKRCRGGVGAARRERDALRHVHHAREARAAHKGLVAHDALVWQADRRLRDRRVGKGAVADEPEAGERVVEVERAADVALELEIGDGRRGRTDDQRLRLPDRVAKGTRRERRKVHRRPVPLVRSGRVHDVRVAEIRLHRGILDRLPRVGGEERKGLSDGQLRNGSLADGRLGQIGHIAQVDREQLSVDLKAKVVHLVHIDVLQLKEYRENVVECELTAVCKAGGGWNVQVSTEGIGKGAVVQGQELRRWGQDEREIRLHSRECGSLDGRQRGSKRHVDQIHRAETLKAARSDGDDVLADDQRPSQTG